MHIKETQYIFGKWQKKWNIQNKIKFSTELIK